MCALEQIIPPQETREQKKDAAVNASMQGLLRLTESDESKPGVFHRDDFILLGDETRVWIVRIEDISLLEARGNITLVHFPEDKFLIRRSLHDCERRLTSSLFFRASRGCIVNLSYVKQTRFLEDQRLSFLLTDGKEVLFSRRQSVLFRKRRGL
jgi:DNA-binding LytR/AlgR family response regulator